MLVCFPFISFLLIDKNINLLSLSVLASLNLKLFFLFFCSTFAKHSLFYLLAVGILIRTSIFSQRLHLITSGIHTYQLVPFPMF